MAGHPRCFVIMPFRTELTPVWESIRKVVEEHFGGVAVRSDEILKPGTIHEQMQSELRRADFCIADVTGNNPNVLWELGFAHALEKSVVCLWQATDKLPFDIHSQRMFQYSLSDLRGLETKLAAVVRATLGDLATTPASTGPRYDELVDLRNKLQHKQPLANGSRNLWTIVSEAVRADANPDWTMNDAKRLMQLIRKKASSPTEHQNTFWWLIVYGVFGYDQIQRFTFDDVVGQTLELVRITNRGLKLLEWLRDDRM